MHHLSTASLLTVILQDQILSLWLLVVLFAVIFLTCLPIFSYYAQISVDTPAVRMILPAV